MNFELKSADDKAALELDELAQGGLYRRVDDEDMEGELFLATDEYDYPVVALRDGVVMPRESVDDWAFEAVTSYDLTVYV